MNKRWDDSDKDQLLLKDQPSDLNIEYAPMYHHRSSNENSKITL